MAIIQIKTNFAIHAYKIVLIVLLVHHVCNANHHFIIYNHLISVLLIVGLDILLMDIYVHNVFKIANNVIAVVAKFVLQIITY